MFRVERDPMDHPLDVDKPLIEILVVGLSMAKIRAPKITFKAVVYSTTQSVGIGCRGLDFHGIIIIQ